MAGPFAKKLAEKFEEEIRFFKGWIDGPKAVGAILPTSSITARRMASVVNPHSGLPVLELGPGTGVITRAILQRGVKPENLYCVEYSEDFACRLRKDFPGVNIIQGDAFDLDTTLQSLKGVVFDSVVCAVPLLNFPVETRVALLENILGRLPEGRPMMQITYSPLPAIPAGRGNYVVEPYDFVLRNVPPARLWTYKRSHS